MADVLKDEGPITLRWLEGCARCQGDGHEDMTFVPLTFPLEREGMVVGTHWAPCPTNGEPIIMVVLKNEK